MHTIFRIGEIKQMNDTDRLWEVELTLTSDNDEQLNALTEKFREKLTPYERGWSKLGALLINLGEFGKAHQLHETLLLQTNDDIEKSDIYNQMGWIHRCNANYELAMSFSQKTLEIRKKNLPLNDPLIGNSYNQLGIIYRIMGKYSEALVCQEKAVEIHQKILPENNPILANSYINLSVIHETIGNYSETLFFAKKAVLIREQLPPFNHQDLALAYYNIALLLSTYFR